MSVIHIISHTHWDREWYQPFQIFRLRLVQLIDRLLDLLDADPHYRYFMLDGQTIVLEDYLALRPENERKIRRYVQEGRIIIGPWYILPDEFLVSPEATIRNLLTGERLCRQFGPKMHIGYIPDPFGHIGQMPQILQGFDIRAACFRRGLADEPCELWWEAPDGSRVFTIYLRDGYDNAASLPTSQPERCAQEILRLRDSLKPYCASEHILLMLGTDHMEPPADTSTAIAWAQQHLEDEVRHSTLSDYVIAVQAALADKHLSVVKGELRSPKRHHLLPGVLSTRLWIKQRNHACETLLEKWAEPFSTFAWLLATGAGPATVLRQPLPILHEAWHLLMQCHPHDSICGCSIDEVHEEMKSRFSQVEQIGEELTRQSLAMLAEQIDTIGEKRPMPEARRTTESARQGVEREQETGGAIVVFNPSSFPRTDWVTLETSLPDGEIVDEAGHILPHQILDARHQDYVNLVCDAATLRSLFGSIHDGQAGNLNIQALQVNREGNKVFIRALVSEEQGPDLAAWQAGIQEIEKYLQDKQIQEYHVRASSLGRRQLAFVAPQIPALGYRTFWVRPKQGMADSGQRLPAGARLLLPLMRFLPRPQRPRATRVRPPIHIENEFLGVTVERDGTLTLTDKRDGRVYPHLHRFLDGGDCGDEYNYAPPPQDRLVTARLRRLELERGASAQRLTLYLDIKVPVSLTADRQARARRCLTLPITSTLTLAHGVPRLDIHTEIENRARDHRLRVHFAAPFAAKQATCDGHFEVVNRPVETPPYDETWVEQPRPEMPQRAFTLIRSTDGGLLIANRGLPEVAVLSQSNGNAEIALTLLRCIGWLSRDDFATRRGHAGPMLETPGAQMIGRWCFDYAILVGEDCRPPYAQAYAFNVPLRAAETGLHGGPLPPRQSFVEVMPEQFIISAIKVTEDGTGWLVRGYNLGAERLQVTLKPWQPFEQAWRLNLAEREIAPLPIAADGRITLPVGGHEIVTVKLRGMRG